MIMKPIVRLLQTANLPILYMLRLEEALLRVTRDNWIFVNNGAKDPAIVMGISGKPHELVHVQEAHTAGIPIIKRFSGGGTVIVDNNTVFSTLIFSQESLPRVEPFPKPIMEFAAEVYSDVIDTQPRSAHRVPVKRRSSQPSSLHKAQFELVENDFTVAGKKIAGNAQCVTKGRWLQHTSFLWDYRQERMALLQEPLRRPAYRKHRKHSTFLTPLIALGMDRREFAESIADAVEAQGFDVQPASIDDVSKLLQEKYIKTTCVLDYDDLLPEVQA